MYIYELYINYILLVSVSVTFLKELLNCIIVSDGT